jgi:sugar (pentulose or hexulose) kinase
LKRKKAIMFSLGIDLSTQSVTAIIARPSSVPEDFECVQRVSVNFDSDFPREWMLS